MALKGNQRADRSDEDTARFIQAAAKFAAGKELGLSEDEILSAISRQARAEMRKGAF